MDNLLLWIITFITTLNKREGELIMRYVLEYLGYHKETKRLWISSMTEKSIREGFDSLKSSKEFDNLYRACIINDDMIDTAGTLCANVKELKAMGAGDIYVCATHGIFSGPAIERLNDAPIVECVVTDAIPVEVGGKIKTISVAEEFAQAISAVYHEEPVSTLVGGDFAL